MKSSMVGWAVEDFDGLSGARAVAMSSGGGGAAGSSRTDLREGGNSGLLRNGLADLGFISTFSSCHVPVWLPAETDRSVLGLRRTITSPSRGSPAIGAGALDWPEGKYEPSWPHESDSSRDLLRDGFVEIGVMESTGVQEIELLWQEPGKEDFFNIEWVEKERGPMP